MASRVEEHARFLLKLHDELVRGDPAAPQQLAHELLRLLRRRLNRSFPRAPADLLVDAVTDAFLTYVARPLAFDVARQVPLDTFLYGIAARIVRDRLRSEKRRSLREGDYAQGIAMKRRDPPDDQVMSRVLVREVRRALPLVCNPSELAAVDGWLNKDDTGVVAIRLGLMRLGQSERRREVQRFTARVIKRLQRYFASTPKTVEHSRKKK